MCDHGAMEPESVALDECQLAAISHVNEYVKTCEIEAESGAKDQLSSSEYLRQEHDRIADLICSNFPIDVHFHPDRIAVDGTSVIAGLLRSMKYDNQYVSGVSNGLLDNSITGARGNSRRKQWEARLFGCAYDGHADSLRPKYGAINLFKSLDGACPRFGSCYLRLKPEVRDRCTLTYGDSHTEPEYIGTPKLPKLILQALCMDYSDSGKAGNTGASLRTVSQRLEISRNETQGEIPTRILDDYVEVQVHGDLRIDRDVDYLSVDSSFTDTQTGDEIIELAANASIGIHWRPRLRLQVSRVPADFRGELLVNFMKHAWPDGYVDAHQLGRFAQETELDPQAWNAWGELHEIRQLVKKTWHSIVAYGEPL